MLAKAHLPAEETTTEQAPLYIALWEAQLQNGPDLLSAFASSY